MEPKFQTSFIPKNPISVSTPDVSKYKSISILSTIGTIIFVLTVFISGGLWGYETLLNSQIATDDKALSQASAAFDPSTMNELITASNQLKSAQDLLANHVAVSNIFTLLQASLLLDVQFTSFDFSRDPTGKVKISTNGQAVSYSILAEQSDIFSNINYMSNQSFSDFNLNDKGLVDMKFQADINPDQVSYKKALEGIYLDNSSTATSTGI